FLGIHSGLIRLTGLWVDLPLSLGCFTGFKAWAAGKIMSREKVDRDAMYRVFKSLWFTKEEGNFVALKEGVILCLFAMSPFVKDQDLDAYAFNLTPFWLRIFNIPFEYMDRQVAMDVGKAIGEVVAIDWRDRDGGWTENIRIRVMIDVFKPFRRVVHLVGSDGTETVCAIKYEDCLHSVTFAVSSAIQPKSAIGKKNISSLITYASNMEAGLEIK
ncbi:hypothetical protein Gohar_008963, partial [Gossypium harknessii]|nr:hypothetical protein [Gossypium harknessii]